MSPRELHLPRDPEAVAQAAESLYAHMPGDRDRAWAAAQEWAAQAAPDRTEDAQATLAADVLQQFDALDPEPQESPPPTSRPPTRRPERVPTEPEPERAERVPERPPAPSPADPDMARRLKALAEETAGAEPTAISPTPRWDSAEQATLAGVIQCASWADLRQRTGPVRVLTLMQADGTRIECWCSWQQLVALLSEAEAQRGRSLAPGDLIAIHAGGSQRVGKSRSPSRMFTVAVEWAD